MKKNYILCSAIWVNDFKIYDHQPKNIESGIVVCGQGHHNCFVILAQTNISYKEHKKIQGFLTADNRFVDRKEAGDIAFKSGQIDKKTDKLYSEDLFKDFKRWE